MPQLLLAIIPTIPKLLQLFTKPKTGIKENAVLFGIPAAALTVWELQQQMGGWENVPEQAYVTLASAVIGLILHLSNKDKEQKVTDKLAEAFEGNE